MYRARAAGGPFRCAQRYFRADPQTCSRLYNIEKTNNTALYQAFLNEGRLATESNRKAGIVFETSFGATHRSATLAQSGRAAEVRMKALCVNGDERNAQLAAVLEDSLDCGMDIASALEVASSLDTVIRKAERDATPGRVTKPIIYNMM